MLLLHRLVKLSDSLHFYECTTNYSHELLELAQCHNSPLSLRLIRNVGEELTTNL